MANRADQANEYMKQKMLFTPRMFKGINQLAPQVGERFADFYESVWADGNLPRKIKELMFVSIGVAYLSPRCIVHVVPAVEAGAKEGEIFEATAVGMLAAGFVPGGPGIPYAYEYAAKAMEIAAKHRAGEKWEYLPDPKFDHGVG